MTRATVTRTLLIRRSSIASLSLDRVESGRVIVYLKRPVILPSAGKNGPAHEPLGLGLIPRVELLRRLLHESVGLRIELDNPEIPFALFPSAGINHSHAARIDGLSVPERVGRVGLTSLLV